MNIEKSCRSQLFPILTGLALPLCSSATAEVIVYFEQDGPDVTASWSGRIDPGLWTAEFLPGSTFSSAGAISFVSASTSSPAEQFIGTFSSPFPSLQPDSFSQVEVNQTFGISNSFLFLPGQNDDSPPAFSVFEFDPNTHIIRFPGRTLAEARADRFDNDLAWTSSTGDTIRFTTEPVAVPEPSSALLGFFLLGSLCLLNRRR